MMLLILVTSNESNAQGIVPSEDNEIERIKTTAYMLNGITSSGQHTRSGICAGASWMVNDAINKDGSWVAMIWTLDGEFLGYYEVLDNGGTDAIRDGYVVDVWFETYEECKKWMTITEGKCLVKYVWSVG